MHHKKITFHTAIKKTATQQPIETTWCVFASDYNSVQVEFVVSDLRQDELRTVTPTILLVMEDGSVVQRTKEEIVQKKNVFSYKLKDNEVNHIGVVKAQLRMETITGEKYQTNIYTFTILESLDSVPVPKEFVIDDIQNILQEVKHHINHIFKDETTRKQVFEEFIKNATLNEKQRESWFKQSQQSRASLFQVFMDEAGEVLKDAQKVKDLFDELVETGVIETNIREKLGELETSYAPRLSTLEQNDVSLTAQLQQRVEKSTFEQFELSINQQLAETASGNKPTWSVWTEFEDRSINVKWFGAKGDGVTDDTDSIRRAIASIDSGVVFFPKGKYRVTDSVRLKDNIAIVGESQFSTFMYPDCDLMNTATTIKHCFTLSKACKNIVISKIGLDSSNVSPTILASALFTSLYPVENFFGSDLFFVNCFQGIKFANSKNIVIDNILLEKPTMDLLAPPENALSFVRCESITINNVTVNDTAEIIDFSQCTNFVVTNVIGNSTVGDENEAIDVGGCSNGVLSNIVTVGYGGGVKLKQEGVLPEYLVTKNITIQGCRFTEFALHGIQFLTRETLDDYVIKNIQIIDCVLTSSNPNSIGIYNQGLPVNYGADGVDITGCSIDTVSYAIRMDSVNNVNVIGNPLITSAVAYNAVQFMPGSFTNFTKRSNYVIKDNTIISTNGATCIRADKIYGLTIDDNTMTTNSIATGVYGLYLTNNKDLTANANRINGGAIGILASWTDEEFLHAALKLIKANVNNNAISNFALMGIRLNLDMNPAVTGPYNLAKVSDNFIYNDETVTLDTQIGIQFRAKNLTGGFDFVKSDNNLIYRVPTPIGYDGVVFGANCTTENNTTYTGV